MGAFLKRNSSFLARKSPKPSLVLPDSRTKFPSSGKFDLILNFVSFGCKEVNTDIFQWIIKS